MEHISSSTHVTNKRSRGALDDNSIYNNEQIPNNGLSSSPTKKTATHKNQVGKQDDRRVAAYLDELSIGFLKGINGYDQYHPPTGWIKVREPIFFSLANNHNNFCLVPFGEQTLMLNDVGTNVEIHFLGVTKILPDTSIQKIRFQLCEELFGSAARRNYDLYVFTWNIGNFGKNFTIYSEPFTGTIDQSLPHMLTPNGGYIKELNCKVPRPVSGKKFTCRHFVTQLFKQYLANQQGMAGIHWPNFGDKDLIAQTMPDTIDTDFQTALHNARSYEFLQNDLFGKHIDRCFKKMEQRNQAFMLLKILSTTHVMGCILEIQQTEDGKAKPVIWYYNPQHTNTAVRCIPNDSQTIKALTLELFINGTGQVEHDYYGTYYRGGSPVSVVMEIDASSFVANSALLPPNFRNFLPEQLTASHMHYLFMLGCHEQVESLLPQLRTIGERSSEDLFTLLHAIDTDEMPWLHNALAKNCEISIRALKNVVLELKHLIPDHKLIELLAANSTDGTPGIYFALKKGLIQSIQLFNELVGLISDKTQLTNLMSANSTRGIEMLLTRPNANGETLLHRLFKNGQHDSLTTILFLLPGLAKYIPAPTLAEIIAAKNHEGKLGIEFAIEKGDAKTIALYNEFLQFIPQTMRPKLTIG